MGVQLGIERAVGVMRHNRGNHIAGGAVLVRAVTPNARGSHGLDFPQRLAHRFIPPTGDPRIATDEVGD